ncbi:MAG: 4Fe-4S dicluster domain-containing protein [Spirochaetota bacterium]|nr:MAG: 4Fe-4S dicluster domain-containing protein [Spirochaetota bacterium]
MNISELIKSSGVVGAGGAGFPTHVKVEAEIDTVIVNGAECEPLLENDKWLLEKESKKVIKGLEYLIDACGARRGVIALKQKYKQPMIAIKKAIGKRKSVEVFELGDFYPAGDEFILVYEVTGRIVPEGGIPLKVGCLVDNVETVLNVYEAIENKRPVTRRWLTCTGEVEVPSVVNANIGVPLADVIDLCGGITVPDAAVVIGGPLMGSIEKDLQAPVTKTTTGIIVLPEDHEIIRKKTIPVEFIIKLSKSVCCQCTYCTEMCPRYLIGHGLKPHLIMRQINLGIDIPAHIIKNAFLCSECGLCEVFACVMELSPAIMNRSLKERLIKEGLTPHFPERKVEAREMKEYRKIPTSRIVQRLGLSAYREKPLRRGVKTDPERIELLLKQHIGEVSVPIVKVGDKVQEGQPIAEIPEGCLGARVHSSISGMVTFCDDERVIIERQG